MASRADDPGKKSPQVLDLDDEGVASQPKGGGPPDLAQLLRTGERWGYVDDDGGIHVRAGRFTADRVVARVPPSKRAETLAGLLLRFAELEERFAALRRELRRSRNPVRSLRSLQSFVHWVEGAEAIGDYDSLLGRARAEIARIEAHLADSRSAKLELVERAEALADSTSWRSAGDELDELMRRWKKAGSAGRDEDDELWRRFNEARRAFFTRRNAHFAELKRGRAEVVELKEALIARAGELAPSTDYEGTFESMQALLEEWKKAGSAGRAIDEELWQRFHAAREPFFERRRVHLAEQRRARSQRRDRGGPAARAGGRRPDRGRRDQPRRAGGGEPGVLRASLADLVGPLRDLLPAAGGPGDSPSKGDGDDEDGRD